MKKVLITGGTGFIGKTLIRKLFRLDFDIFVLARKEEDISKIKSMVNIVYSDYSSTSLDKVFPSNIDAIIHLAWAGVNGPLKSDESVQSNNIDLALRVAEAAVNNKVKRFVGIGTITELAYLNNKDNKSPTIIYGKYKYLCFQRLKDCFSQSTTKFVWLRLANLYGIDNLSGNILGYTFQKLGNNESAEYGPCDQYYDFVYIDDEIDAITRFLMVNSYDKDNYYLGSNQPMILKKYITLIGNLLDKNDLIKIGARPNDNIKYNKEMFNSNDAFHTIGNYITKDFNDRIETLYKSIK